MAETSAVFLRDQNKIRSPRLFNDYSDTVGGLISAQLTLFCQIIISSLFIVYSETPFGQFWLKQILPGFIFHLVINFLDYESITAAVT